MDVIKRKQSLLQLILYQYTCKLSVNYVHTHEKCSKVAAIAHGT